MTEKDLYAELEMLRNQLAEIASRQEEDRTTYQAVAQSMERTGTQPPGASPPFGSAEWFRHLPTQAANLLHEAKIDLNEVPAATALTVFALGVLVGRLTSK